MTFEADIRSGSKANYLGGVNTVIEACAIARTGDIGLGNLPVSASDKVDAALV